MTSPTQPRSLAALFPILHRLPEPIQDAIAVVLLLMIVIPGLASSARIAADIWIGERDPHDYPGSPLKAAKEGADWLSLSDSPPEAEAEAEEEVEGPEEPPEAIEPE